MWACLWRNFSQTHNTDHLIQIKHAKFVGAEKNEKFISLPTSDSHMLRNHEAGLSYIKNPQKKKNMWACLMTQFVTDTQHRTYNVD